MKMAKLMTRVALQRTMVRKTFKMMLWSNSRKWPSASNLEDVQNVAEVKLEEVDWEQDYLQQTAERPSTNGPQVSDLMEDVPIKLPIEKRILLRVLHLMTS